LKIINAIQEANSADTVKEAAKWGTHMFQSDGRDY
jgi:hypothetical protein